MNDFVVYSPDKAGLLIDKGFKLKNQKRNKLNPACWVYFFVNTPELRQAMYELTHEGRADD